MSPRNPSPRRRLPSPTRRPRRGVRLLLEALEDRAVPAVFNVGPGDTAGLIDALNRANTELAFPGPDVIRLAPESTYTFTAPDNFYFGPNALPPVTSAITIEGN